MRPYFYLAFGIFLLGCGGLGIIAGALFVVWAIDAAYEDGAAGR